MKISQIWITLDHINTQFLWQNSISEGQILLKEGNEIPMGCCSRSVLLPLIFLMNLVSVLLLHSYSQEKPSLFSVGFYPLCHVCFCYSFSEILVVETRGRLPSNNKITMDDLLVFSNYITRGKLNSLGLPQLLALKSVHGCCLWLAPLSPQTQNPRIFPHKMLTPPLAPPTSP